MSILRFHGRPCSRGAPAALLAAGLALLTLEGAVAQSFVGRTAPKGLVLPSEEVGGAQRPAPQREQPVRVATPVVETTPPIPQRPLPSIGESLRLVGEESSLQWPVYLTEAQIRERVRFRIGYLAAISVMPESSFITATVNETVIGRGQINAPGAVKIIEFDIPEGVLKPGYNAVRLAGVQRHRVDCSVPATFELWTQIDPSWTGFILPPGTGGVASLRDLPALPPDGQGIVPIRIVLPGRPSPASFERIIRAAQRLALVGRFSQTVVEFGPFLSGPAGINLVVGTAEELRAVPDFDAGSAIGGTPLSFYPATERRAATVVITGADGEDLDAGVAALKRREGSDSLFGSPQGLRVLALAKGVPVRGGDAVRLDTFGVQNREFSGRLFRSGFDLTLPADFVPADYARIELSLDGGYAPGLETGAQIMVDINGRNAASVPLPNRAGDRLRGEPIALPLDLWRPGRNHVDVRALLPTEADRTCDTANPADEQKRFLLLNTSSLKVPPLARALRVPDLAATASSGLPYTLSAKRPRLVVPTPDRETMGAATTIAVQMAIAADRVIDFTLSADRPADRDTPAIVVAPARALDPALLRTIGLDPDSLRQIWQGRAEPAPAPPGSEGAKGAGLPRQTEGMSLDRLQNNVPPACALPTAHARVAALATQRSRPLGSKPRNEAADIATAWDATVRPAPALSDQIAAVASQLGEVAESSLQDASNWVKGQVKDPPVEIGSRASLVVGQGVDGEGLGSVVTVFTAPNAALLQASVTCLSSPVLWSKLQGRIAALDANDGSINTFEAKRSRLLETEPRSLGNLRLVFAGWLSMNPSLYVLALFAAAIALGLSTNAMLRNVGRANLGARSGPSGTVQHPDETTPGEGS
ncbi:cellulose biosynthesis cyclic di-GMP-binding regulatory protein BcsB [Methylobacterium durans]|uniref:Cyclic di-GMP-binding protein n=1 Tax=Methylobacterium durans TaxID=2202825 RepID=A0A2U8W8X7_9HYPH|nr:cellulose biosynthesis cyclic di-GMP-binding regulatory protein BcsB [Methylobacterium durans]AWN41776.1 cellulose synthase [Methylobacterium durans]